jgi:hypothetical protein
MDYSESLIAKGRGAMRLIVDSEHRTKHIALLSRRAALAHDGALTEAARATSRFETAHGGERENWGSRIGL